MKEWVMITLTGFDDRPKTPAEWRAYIEGLESRRDAWLTEYRELKAARRLTSREHLRYWSRYDLLSEHIARAEGVLEYTLEHGFKTASWAERFLKRL